MNTNIGGYKICPRCAGVANWNNNFYGYTCMKCGWIQKVPKKQPEREED